MKRREMKLLLEERFERIALLETRIDNMDQLVGGYRAREQAVLNTLQTAKENAAKIVEQAKAEGARVRAEAERTLNEAEQVRQNARSEAEALLSEAISTATTLKTEAERKGVEMTANVRADSERMLRDADIIKREYEEMVDTFNAMLEQNASELEITAARFAEFVKDRKIDRTEARLDGNAFYKSVGELNDTALPDASGNPSLLMQNIYRIQNRPLPEDRVENTVMSEPQPHSEGQKTTQDDSGSTAPSQSTASADREPATEPAQAENSSPEFPMEDGSGADERRSTASEPYSEAAWVNGAQQSESEPQAEFSKSFDNAFTKSDYTIHDDECSVTRADAENEFDALMSEQGSFAEDAAAAAIPDAAELTAELLPEQPMEDAVRAFDAYFDEHFEPAGNAARDENLVEQATQPQVSAPEPETYIPETQEEESFEAETADETPEVTVAAEPYSERAWAQESFTSDIEPQAEGALFGAQNVDVIAPAASYEGNEQQPTTFADAEKAFDEYLAKIGMRTPAATASAEAEETSETATPPEPYSARAWENESFTSDLEPQAEGTLLGEQNNNETAPAAADANNETTPSSFSDAEKAFDDYLAGIGMLTPTVPNAEEATETLEEESAEPYSEQAWANESLASDREPQAENESSFSAEEYEEYEEPAPAPRRYNEYGEIREWEPEPEPDMSDVPTVSRYMGQSESSDEISLDDLLDEIIKAGE